jgi:hypothetical protein
MTRVGIGPLPPRATRRAVTGPVGDPLAEAVELTRRLKLPHIRKAMADLIPTAKAQRWDPAEVTRVLLAEESAGKTMAWAGLTERISGLLRCITASPAEHVTVNAARWRSRWPLQDGQVQRWVRPAAAAVSASLAVAVGVGASIRQERLAGIPEAAVPGAVVLLAGAVAALATMQPWGRRLPRHLVTGTLWTVAGSCLACSCWILLDLCQLVLQGTVTDRAGKSDWLPFGERFGLTIAGALFVGTALAWQRTIVCTRCGRVHAVVTTGPRPAQLRPASQRVRWIGYAGCLAWLPYAGLHTLGALGVPGIEPDGYRPPVEVAIVFWFGIGLSVFLLLGLVSPWGLVFPRWVAPLAGRRVPRMLPIVPVWLIAPTFVLYGLGSAGYVLLLAFGVVTWHGGHGHIGVIGFAEPTSFAGYGLAVTIAAVSYHRRTRRVPAVVAPCPFLAATGAPADPRPVTQP